jgi:HAD superfamily hydrolase (TIGR01549 family)
MRGEGPPRAVVFDFDGTLIDSLPLVLAAIRHAIEPFGGRPTMNIFAHLGGPPSRFLASLVDDPRHVPEALRRLTAYHRENVHLIRPFAGARELLMSLQEAGVKSAVWTGRDRASANSLLRQHRLDGLLAALVCGDDLPSHKPDPAGLRAILRRLELNADEAVLVGDADVDILGANSCGMPAVLIRQDGAVPAEMRALSCQVVADPAEAFAWVRRRVGLPPPSQFDRPSEAGAE